MTNSQLPCSWPVSYGKNGICAAFKGEDGKVDADTVQTFEEMATAYLWLWTGRKYGLCDRTARPSKYCTNDSTFWGRGPFPWESGNSSATFIPLLCGTHLFSGCGCCDGNRLTSIVFSDVIHSVTTISIDGDVLPPEDYRVDDQHRLVRTDGKSWPTEQDLTSDLGEPGTWSVKYQSGMAVPTGGQVAAGILACEMAKAAVEDKSCRLPKRIQSITRQGVSMEMLDSFDDIDEGHTGIWIVDSWVASVSKSPAGSTVTNPDLWLKSRKSNAPRYI